MRVYRNDCRPLGLGQSASSTTTIFTQRIPGVLGPAALTPDLIHRCFAVKSPRRPPRFPDAISCEKAEHVVWLFSSGAQAAWRWARAAWARRGRSMGAIGRGRWPVVDGCPTDARRTAPAGSSTGPWSEALQRVEPKGVARRRRFPPLRVGAGDGVSAAGRTRWPQTPNRKWRRISLKTLETGSEMAGPTRSLTRESG